MPCEITPRSLDVEAGQISTGMAAFVDSGILGLLVKNQSLILYQGPNCDEQTVLLLCLHVN